MIIDKLNNNQPITQADINALRSVIFRSTVSQGTERVKLSYADRTNLKQLPPTTQFSNIGYIDGKNLTHLYENFTDGSTPQTSCGQVTCSWDFTYPVPPIGGGLYEIQFNGKLGGTVEDLSAPLTIDGNVPAAPLILTIDKIKGGQDQQTNIFQNAFYSNSSIVLIKGVSDPLNQIVVKDQNNKTICSVSSSSIGFWSCQVDISSIQGYNNLTTQVGNLNLSVTATLNANTTNSISPKTLIIDEIKPVITSLTTSTIWHRSGDIADISLGANKVLSYAIDTDIDPGLNCINAPLQQKAVTELFVNSNYLGAIGSFQIPGYAIEGRYCTKVEVQDIAGNRTDANFVLNIDNTIPNIPTIDGSQWGTLNGYYAQGGNIANGRLNPGYVVKTPSVSIAGLGEENMNIELFVNGVMKGTATALNHLQSNTCSLSKYPDPLQSVPNTPYQNPLTLKGLAVGSGTDSIASLNAGVVRRLTAAQVVQAGITKTSVTSTFTVPATGEYSIPFTLTGTTNTSVVSASYIATDNTGVFFSMPFLAGDGTGTVKVTNRTVTAVTFTNLRLNLAVTSY